jgi:hypothetical protein
LANPRNVSHPGVAPTSLLVVGTVDSTKLPALMAATSPDARDGGFQGQQWPGNVGGPPGEQKLWKPLRDNESASRLWSVSQDLTGVDFT